MITTTFDNTNEMIDSRDVIARIEELDSMNQNYFDAVEEAKAAYSYHDSDDTKSTPEWSDLVEAKKALSAWYDSDEFAELEALRELAAEAESSPDWIHGEQLIRASYFVQYITELIDDCYGLPKELTSGDWPYRHITIDFEAAAKEAEWDYNSVDFDGVEYLIRA
jgi:uncharacterized protein (DUF1330 family)